MDPYVIVVFIAGDKAVVDQVRGLVGPIEAVAVKEDIRDASLGMSPAQAEILIQQGVEKAVRNRAQAKPYTMRSGSYGSLYFTITGFHMAHVVVGLVALLLIFFWCVAGYFDERRNVPLLIGAAYWHFVDIVWLTVFFTFYLMPRIWS